MWKGENNYPKNINAICLKIAFKLLDDFIFSEIKKKMYMNVVKIYKSFFSSKRNRLQEETQQRQTESPRMK